MDRIVNGNGVHCSSEDEDDKEEEIQRIIELEDSTPDSDDFDDPQEDVRDADETIPEPGTEAALEYGKFNPPLYRQRYNYVLEELSNPKWVKAFSRIVDFGCAECKFLQMLKVLPRAREIIGVDIDGNLLEEYQQRIEPLFIDYIEPRQETPLDAFLLQGSIAEFDARLENVDAVTAIELIEHLPEEQLEAFPQVIFGQMKPKIVIITTPNQEYNVLFENFEGPFRHYDHKFEWNRRDFHMWIQRNVIEVYPDYVVDRFHGVGEGPEAVGHCSQLVVLLRKDFQDATGNGEFENITVQEDDNLSSDRNFLSTFDPQELYKYKIISRHQYPMRRETRSREEIIFDEAHYKLYDLAQGSVEWEGQESALIALENLLEYEKIQERNVTIQELCDILEGRGFQIQPLPNGSIGALVPCPESSDSEEENEECDYFIEPPAEVNNEGDEDWN